MGRQANELVAANVFSPQPSGTVNSGPDNASPAPYSINTPLDFAKALLARLNIPANPGAIVGIVAWELAEGGHWRNTAYFNPLNTTQGAPGATSMNSVGVKAYPDWATGLNATVQTLQYPRYQGVLAALRGGNPYNVAQAVGASGWGTGNFSGDIPSAMSYANVSAQQFPNGPSVAPNNTGNTPNATETLSPGDFNPIIGTYHLFFKGGFATAWVNDLLQGFGDLFLEGQSPGFIILRLGYVIGGAFLMSVGIQALIATLVGPPIEHAVGDVVGGFLGFGGKVGRQVESLGVQRTSARRNRSLASMKHERRVQDEGTRRIRSDRRFMEAANPPRSVKADETLEPF